MKPVNPKRNQPWIFIGRTDAEAPILWPPDAKSWLIKKDPDAGKDWRWEEKGMTGDNRGWDGWMASPTQWTWVWKSSRRWWRTGKPGVPWGFQRVGHNWTEWLNSNNWNISFEHRDPHHQFFFFNSQCREQCLVYNRHSINACRRKKTQGNIEIDHSLEGDVRLRKRSKRPSLKASFYKSLGYSMCICMLSRSVVSDSLQLRGLGPPGASVHGIVQSRTLSGFPFPSPGDLPDPVIDPVSCASSVSAGRFFTTVLPGKPPYHTWS